MSASACRWRSRPLSELATTTSGGTPSRNRKDYFNGIIPWIKSGELNDGYIHKAEEHITEAGLENSSAKLLPPGTVLIAMYGATIGKTAILKTEASTNQAICCIRPGPNLDADYLRFHLMFLRDDLLSHSHGGAQPNISQQIVRNQTISYPPLREQKAISHSLLAVQRAIKAQDLTIQITTELKKALMQKLFSEGLRGEPQKETEIGLVPESWEICTVGNVAVIQSGGTPAREEFSNWERGTIPWVKTGEINYCTILETEEKITHAGLANSAAKLFPPGTLLMAMYGQGVTRGRVAMLGIEAATNQACAAFIPMQTKTPNLKYLFYYFQHHYEDLRRLGHGANQKNMNAALIRSFPLALPEPAEQQEIAKSLSTIDRKLTLHDRNLTQLQSLFSTLLYELMSSRILIKAPSALC